MDNVPNDLSGVFEDEEMDRAAEWSLLMQAVIRMAPEINRDLMKTAIDNLAAKCNERWLEIEREGSVVFNSTEMGIPLDQFSGDVQEAITGKIAFLLMAGRGGPFETAVILKEGIDDLANEIEANA